MFNLIVKYSPWADGQDTVGAGRTFEYTTLDLETRFKPGGRVGLTALAELPTLFVAETLGKVDPVAHVGTITRARLVGQDIVLNYSYDPAIPGIPNSVLQSVAPDLGIEEFEFSRTHWSVKDADLYRALLRGLQPRKLRPRVFKLADPEGIEPSLVSAMMPFSPAFDAVYATLQSAAQEAALRCRRADDIWENPAVIQDVVSLIDKSSIVIADCTGRNPNVFYEIGIAHTLGREVILITQAAADIPFDLRHLRFVTYLNNGEGLRSLSQRVLQRMQSIAGVPAQLG